MIQEKKREKKKRMKIIIIFFMGKLPYIQSYGFGPSQFNL